METGLALHLEMTGWQPDRSKPVYKASFTTKFLPFSLYRQNMSFIMLQENDQSLKRRSRGIQLYQSMYHSLVLNLEILWLRKYTFISTMLLYPTVSTWCFSISLTAIFIIIWMSRILRLFFKTHSPWDEWNLVVGSTWLFVYLVVEYFVAAEIHDINMAAKNRSAVSVGRRLWPQNRKITLTSRHRKVRGWTRQERWMFLLMVHIISYIIYQILVF